MLLLTAIACKSGKKAYQRGNYEQAVNESIDRLRSSPDNKNAKYTLRQAYPAMLNLYDAQIATAKQSSDELRWETVRNLYANINATADNIRRCPGALRVIPQPKAFQAEYEEASTQAAQVRYALGERAMQRGDRQSAKEAYRHYSESATLKPNLFADIEAKRMRALEVATLVVQIAEIPMSSRAYQLSTEFFEQQIRQFVESRPGSEFVRFVDNSYRGHIDHVVRMQFDDFVVGQAYVKESLLDRKKDSAIKKEIREGATVRYVYLPAEAQVHLWQKTISSSGLLDVQIQDANTQRLLQQQKFNGTFAWTDSWGTYKGDKRALLSSDLEATKKDRELPPPPPQQLFVEFTKPIFSQVTNYLRNYYRGM